MDIQNVITLIEAVSNANIMNFQIEEGNFKLSMDKLTQRMEVAPANLVSNIDMQRTNMAPFMTMGNTAIAAPTVAMPEAVASTGVEVGKTEVKTAAVQNTAAVQADDANIKVIECPIVGTYYSAAGPDSDDFVKVGDVVKSGQILCIVEAMKLMNDIESDFAGEIVEILVQNEQMVEYGQPLFKIKV